MTRPQPNNDNWVLALMHGLNAGGRIPIFYHNIQKEGGAKPALWQTLWPSYVQASDVKPRCLGKLN
jgi:hypothetical protein